MGVDVHSVQEVCERVRENVSRVIVGKDHAIEQLLVALLCEGHVLVEDVPGVGKTMLVKSLARSLNCAFQRIQFTPDLLPSDIIGVSVFNQGSGHFDFRPGPIFAQLVLADEINRAGPRTQSALLEAMQERQVTVDGKTYPLQRPYMVLATQNPVELEGTFPLPEAQMDRFLMRVGLGYPSEDEEYAILQRFRLEEPFDTLEPVVDAEDIAPLATTCRHVYVHKAVAEYMIGIARATRTDADLALGVSPRGVLALHRACQVWAALHGRDYVLPDDVQSLVLPVYAHRLLSSARLQLRGDTTTNILQRIIARIPVPVEETFAEKTTR
jgi:MoxR-like ATPase